MSGAYLLALTHLRDRFDRGELDADDLVFTVDADGQHDLAVLDELVRATVDEHLDAMLARRDLSYHGPTKKLGNWILSAWASAWAGQRLYDVESGYRIFRLGALTHALDYYSGRNYSETVEVAVVMSRLGYRVRNDRLVPVPVARSRTSLTDAAVDFAAIPMAASRVWHADQQGRAPATLSIAAVLALVLALGVGHGAGGALQLALAAFAAAAAGLLVRRLVPNGSLPITGACVAAVSAWLVPQRADLGGTVALAVLFSIAVAIASPPARCSPRAARDLRRRADPLPARSSAHRPLDRGGRGRRHRVRARPVASNADTGDPSLAALGVRLLDRRGHGDDDDLFRFDHGQCDVVRRGCHARAPRRKPGRDHVRQRHRPAGRVGNDARPRARTRRRHVLPGRKGRRSEPAARAHPLRSRVPRRKSVVPLRPVALDGSALPGAGARTTLPRKRARCVSRGIARRAGGRLRSSRRRCTSTACRWFSGTYRSAAPRSPIRR